MTDWNPSDTPNFSREEMACRCCGRSDMNAEFMEKLQTIRNVLGPMPVSSGYRCPEYNAQVSSTGSTGPHTTGKAADIRISGEQVYRLLKLAYMENFSGIGVSQKGPHGSRFIHLDTLQDGEGGAPRPRIWSY